MLRQRPFLGQRRNDLQAGLRAFCVKRYVIFYRFDDQAVTILRVLHGARDASAVFAENIE
jgi:toxin ParE1/3/4